MHLAVFARYRSVFLYHHGGVVVESCSSLFEERYHHHHSQAACQFTEEVGRRSGYCLREVEVVHIFHLTEIQGVVQLREDDQFGATSGEVCHVLLYGFHIFNDVCSLLLLQNSYS